MAFIKPFKAIRPKKTEAKDIAALPYDVYNRKEAKEAVIGKPLSFLNIDRPVKFRKSSVTKSVFIRQLRV